MKILFTCGGTAGHINPALAVASGMKERFPDCEILFIGASGNMEEKLVPLAGFDIKTVKITNISREHSLSGVTHNIDTVKNVFVSSVIARHILKEFCPDIVVGTGGYVCFPVLSAAHELHIPSVIHESNAYPGLTTRMLSRLVDKIMVGVEGCAQAYPDASKVVCTGTPVRREFTHLTRAAAREELQLRPDEKLVLSVWGSLGAAYMNDTVLQMISGVMEEDPSFRLIHVTGSRYYEGFMAKLNEQCPGYAQKGIAVYEYLHNLPAVMMAADLILCRSGASTLSELAYAGKPSILVPSPNVTENHQEKNARVLENSHGAKVMLEGQFRPADLYREICSILNDPEELAKMSAGAKSCSGEDATAKIIRVLLDLLKK